MSPPSVGRVLQAHGHMGTMAIEMENYDDDDDAAGGQGEHDYDGSSQYWCRQCWWSMMKVIESIYIHRYETNFKFTRSSHQAVSLDDFQESEWLTTGNVLKLN